METSPDLVVSALTAGEPSTLLHRRESLTVDFKAEPYQIATARQKQELAKDVAAFANAEGGAIVLGFKTTKSGVVAADIVAEVRPIPESQFREEAWTKLLNEWVYPAVEGFTCRWFPAPDGGEKGFAVLLVPEQAAVRKPFLVTRTVGDDDKVEGAIFGLFERRRADAEPVSVYEVQGRLRDGDLLRRVLDIRENPAALQALAARQDPQPSAPVTAGASLPPVEDRVDALVSAVGLGEAPAYIVVAAAEPAITGRDLFGARGRAANDLLEHPPEIRDMGFDLNTGASAEISEGRSRRAVTPRDKGLELWRDGVLVFVATAGSDFLAWGDRTPDAPLRINPLVLVESTLLFADLTSRLLEVLGHQPTTVAFTLLLRRMCVAQQPAMLAAYRLGARVSPWNIKAAPQCDASFVVRAVGTFDPPAVTYALIAEVYHWFGLEESQIPYVDRDGPEPRVSVDALRPA